MALRSLQLLSLDLFILSQISLRMTLQNCTPYLSSYMLMEKVELIGSSVCPDK